MYRFKPCTKCGAPALYNKDDEMTEVDRTPVKRVWGEYSTIAEYDGIKIKELRVSPGGTLSFQRHEKSALALLLSPPDRTESQMPQEIKMAKDMVRSFFL